MAWREKLIRHIHERRKENKTIMVSVQSFVILAVLVAVLYSKWLIVMFLYSLIALSVAADRLPGARLRRLLRMPLGAADRITRYGVSRFVMYNISVLK